MLQDTVIFEFFNKPKTNFLVILIIVIFKKYLGSKGGFSSYCVDIGLIQRMYLVVVFVSVERHGIGPFCIKDSLEHSTFDQYCNKTIADEYRDFQITEIFKMG